jgi:hypothetical protein
MTRFIALLGGLALLRRLSRGAERNAQSTKS